MNEQFLEELRQILISLDQRTAKLEHTLNDVIIQSWREAAEEELAAEQEARQAAERKAAIDAFTAKYPQVSELSGPLKALYGDDYDVYGDLYDSMQGHLGDEGFDEGSYVNGQIEDVRGRLGSIADGSYAESEAPVEEVVDEAQLARELAAAS